jgi:hypothetical protein
MTINAASNRKASASPVAILGCRKNSWNVKIAMLDAAS